MIYIYILNELKQRNFQYWCIHIYIYAGMLQSHEKNEKMLFVATWMGLQIITLSEVSPTKTSIWYSLYVKSKKKWYKWTCVKNRNKLREWTYGWGERMAGGRDVREGSMDMYPLLYLKWITTKDPLYSRGNSAQCYIAT